MDYNKRPFSEVNNASKSQCSKIPVSATKLPKPSNRYGNSFTGKRKAETEPETALNPKRLNLAKTGSIKASSTNVTKKLTGTTVTERNGPIMARNATSSVRATVGKPGVKKDVAAAGAIPGKKLQPWDLRGKLQLLEKENALQMTKLNQNKQKMTAEIEALRSFHQQQVKELEEKIKKRDEELEEMTEQVKEMTSTISDLKDEKASLMSELSLAKQECAELKSTVADLTLARTELINELTLTKNELEQMRTLCAEQADRIKQQNDKLIQNESERRILHNTIQELKGNIRVFCRVRPLLQNELAPGKAEIAHIGFPDKAGDGKMIELKKPGELSSNEKSVYEFSFDRVFPPMCTQEEVFQEISQLVQSALDGYHVCIFAYGQTGSGKTYTMEGPDNANQDTEGMIPRAVNQVFTVSEMLKDKGWEYEMEVSFLEIYNETIRDLIRSGRDDVKHTIKMKAADSTEFIVTNLTVEKVTKPSQVYRLLAKAGERRAVAETNCNLRSSRSHSVFQMKISGHNTVTDERCSGLLNLIDLAGSERLTSSGSVDQRLKETKSINKSLSNLGNVIMALLNKDAYIPYRNSKLTHLLQHCLGGNSKVLMFVNVSPKEECFSETLNSLRFASLVNTCNIGTATRRMT